MADAAEGTGAPNRSARKACWDARDGFFECMTRTGEDASACKKQRALFEKDCAASWVGARILLDRSATSYDPQRAS